MNKRADGSNNVLIIIGIILLVIVLFIVLLFLVPGLKEGFDSILSRLKESIFNFNSSIGSIK